MIITLRGADFSASNIGQLPSWRIYRSIGNGATYEGAYFVKKNEAFSATVTINDGYTLGSSGVVVKMGGVTLENAYSLSDNIITIVISEVIGNVIIEVPTINISTGEEDAGEDDRPVTPVSVTWTTGYYYASHLNTKGYGTLVDDTHNTPHRFAYSSSFFVKAGQTVVLYSAMNKNIAGLIRVDSAGVAVGSAALLIGGDDYTAATREYTATEDMTCRVTTQTLTLPLEQTTIQLKG